MRPKLLLWIGVALLVFTVRSGSALAGNLRPKYVSPRPGATFASPHASIIIRPGDSLQASSVTASMFLVTGTISHVHTGRVSLSDDQKTIIFKPDHEFKSRERVTVVLKPGLLTKSGVALGGYSFGFSISLDHRVVSSLGLAQPGSGVVEEETVADPLYSLSPAAAASGSSDSLPIGFPTITVTTSNNPSDGAIFLSNFQTTDLYGAVPNYLMILANDGSPIWYRQVDSSSMDFKVQPTGLLTYFDAARHVFYGLDSMYNLVDSFKCADGYVTDVHDLLLLPNGHALLFGLDTEVVDMSQYVVGASPQATVIGVILQELDQAKNVVFQWNGFDFYKVTDAIHQNLKAPYIDYVHANSIDVDSSGNILISSRHLDEITKISRDSGEIIWRLGGQNNQFTFLNDTLGFSHQHCVRQISATNITLFDNGNFHTPAFSRACEYKLDEVAKTCELVWQYVDTPTIYNGAMGSVQRLPNGNTLIGWGLINKPEITEVRPDGTKALEISMSDPSVTYRAFRFPWVSKVSASVAQTAQPAELQLQSFPNPATSSTTLRYSIPTEGSVRIALYDVTGREVMKLSEGTQTSGVHQVVVPTPSLSNGLYFCRLSTQESAVEERIMIVR